MFLSRCRISMCQGLGAKKHDEISETGRTRAPPVVALPRSAPSSRAAAPGVDLVLGVAQAGYRSQPFLSILALRSWNLCPTKWVSVTAQMGADEVAKNSSALGPHMVILLATNSTSSAEGRCCLGGGWEGSLSLGGHPPGACLTGRDLRNRSGAHEPIGEGCLRRR